VNCAFCDIPHGEIRVCSVWLGNQQKIGLAVWSGPILAFFCSSPHGNGRPSRGWGLSIHGRSDVGRARAGWMNSPSPPRRRCSAGPRPARRHWQAMRRGFYNPPAISTPSAGALVVLVLLSQARCRDGIVVVALEQVGGGRRHATRSLRTVRETEDGAGKWPSFASGVISRLGSLASDAHRYGVLLQIPSCQALQKAPAPCQQVSTRTRRGKAEHKALRLASRGPRARDV
jgi:hypothetical protein